MIVTVIILLEQIYRVSESLLDISEFEYFSIPVYTSRNSQLVCDIRIHSLSLFSKWIRHSFKLCSLITSLYQTIAGILMLSIVHTVPSADTASPVYVAPPDTPIVSPKAVSEEESVIVVFLYV
jgi:hypothetical protein